MRRVLIRTLEWLGGHELGVLLGLLIVVAGTWGFVALAGEVLEGTTQRFDERMIRACAKPTTRPSRSARPGWRRPVATSPRWAASRSSSW